MSQVVTTEIQCDKCGHTFEKKVYISINARQNPELRKSILDGTFFMQKCRSRGFVIDSFYQTLYHDIDRKFMVWLVKPDADNIIFMQRNSLKVAELLPNQRLSISRYPFQWTERIITLELGMDPRLIELYKFGIKDQQNWPLRTENDFLHFHKFTRSFWGRTKFHWLLVYDDGDKEALAQALDVKNYENYKSLIKSLEPILKPTAWYLIDWQFPFGLEIHDDKLIQLPFTSEVVEVGENKTKFPKQFLDIVERTGKGKRL